MLRCRAQKLTFAAGASSKHGRLAEVRDKDEADVLRKILGVRLVSSGYVRQIVVTLAERRG